MERDNILLGLLWEETCESYVDGELLARNVGKWEHARIQALLALWFGSQEKAWSVKVATEQRVQVSPTRVRIPDVMLVSRGPQPEVIVDPPLLNPRLAPLWFSKLNVYR